MALFVIAQNDRRRHRMTEGDVGDYDCKVMINQRTIWKGHVVGHIRNQGFPALLRLIADSVEGKAPPAEGQDEQK